MNVLLQNMFGQSAQMVSNFVPSLLGAIAILVVGWLAALAAGAAVRSSLKRTTFDNRIAAWVTGGTPVAIERYVGRVVFWIVMLFVAIGVLQALHLPEVAAPVNAMLSQLGMFAPRLGGAVVLLALAWAIARVLKTLVQGALRAAHVDERLRSVRADRTDEDAPTVSESLGEAVYWLVFLLFLPPILGTLALQGLLGPVQSLVDRLLGFLPNVFGAALILAAGWFVANLVRRIVTNLLMAIGTDKLTDRLGLRPILKSATPSAVIGLVVYALILLPVFIAALDAMALTAITAPASTMLSSILQAVPALLGVMILITIAYVVGRAVAHLVSNVLTTAGFDSMLDRAGLTKADAGPDSRPSAWVGTGLLVTLMLLAAIEGADMLGFGMLADLISRFLVLGGHVLLGLAIFGIGLYLSGLAARVVAASSVQEAALLSVASRVSILVLAGAMALRQMGLANEIVTLAFGLIVGAVAVAAAIAFGLGARDAAGRVVDGWTQRLRA